jgi:hypothetical protein
MTALSLYGLLLDMSGLRLLKGLDLKQPISRLSIPITFGHRTELLAWGEFGYVCR